MCEKHAHAQPFGSGVETNRLGDVPWCERVCVFISFLMREYYLISGDMFFFSRDFCVSHPAPPFNTSLIVPIDCSAGCEKRPQQTHMWFNV